MKRKQLYIVTLMTALLLTACSEESATVGQTEDIAAAENVIVLGVKEVVAPETRAEQQKGSIDFTKLTETGFGVYGYEDGNAGYNSSTSTPTLFDSANKNVKFVTGVSGGTAPTTSLDHPGSWEYSGTKTWTAGKKYTFFAYAPYMESAGTAPGITSVKTDDTAGDPTIGYTVAEDPASSVDLLWGVRTDTSKESGLPWKNVTKGQTASAVLFTFYHALCAVGFHAQVIVDQKNDPNNLDDISKLGTLGKADGCKVTLKSITITPTTSLYKSGVLNLNNTTAHQPLWTSSSGAIASLVLDDGSTDGHGAIDDSLLDPNPSDFSDANPSNTSVMSSTSVPGITESANTQTIIKDDNLFMLIPQEKQNYTISIEYFLTYKTETGYHRESKTGTATIENLELVAGVKYYINLVLGLTTFKVTVDANDWTEETQNTTVAIETGTSANESLAKQSTLVFE